MRQLKAAALALALAACGQPAATNEADAQTAPSAQSAQTASGEVSAADRAAVLAALHMTANAQGQVMNECNELSTPSFAYAPLGGTAGVGILFAMGGGPNTATCYGDGQLLYLFVRNNGALRQVYEARGRMFVLMTTNTRGVRDIADGGPGFSFPLWTWNGSTYVNSGRSVPNSALSDATFLPQ